MKKIFLALLVFASASVNAQKHFQDEVTSPAKAMYVELGGPGVASINYDMRFTKSESGIGGRIGVGGFSINDGIDKVGAVFIPIGVNYIMSKDSRHYFEVGGGVTFVSTHASSGTDEGNFSSNFGHLNFGYRLQPKDGGFFFRAAINPVFGKGFFLPYYAGLGFGYKF